MGATRPDSLLLNTLKDYLENCINVLCTMYTYRLSLLNIENFLGNELAYSFSPFPPPFLMVLYFCLRGGEGGQVPYNVIYMNL